MKYLSADLIYVSFFVLIGMVCYFTESAWGLLGLMFAPSIESKGNDKNEIK